MKAIPHEIPDVILFEPDIYEDQRGFFFESFNQKKFKDATGCNSIFVQDNHSNSQKNVLRGIHYQLPPKAQGKLVRATRGEIFDIAVDIRANSPTFGQWVGATLTEINRLQMWIPEGFAHAFLTISDTAEVQYKTTNDYAPELERCIAWDDPIINIQWPLKSEAILSPKDAMGVSLKNSDTFP